ncbi:MAG: ACP S-malonyltransferase [Spirochaetes bacterium]|nr:ACP S-malonyltransferase [Spirochaetota bacterium]
MLVFPGQGSQFVGMGKFLYDNFSIAKEIYDKARKIVSEKFIEISFNGNEVDIAKTEYSQVIIFLYTYSLFQILKSKNILSFDNYYAGHSLGEVISFAIAEYISFEECLKLIRFRGEVMSSATSIEGGMAALIFPDIDQILETLKSNEYKDKVFIANYNSANQIVISGDKKLIESFCNNFDKKLFKKFVILKVSQAFHTVFMNSAKKEFENYLKDININLNSNNIFSNVTGEIYPKDEKKIKELLARQIESSVLWLDIINNSKEKVKEYIEVGPSSILIPFIKTIVNENDYKLLTYCGDKSLL